MCSLVLLGWVLQTPASMLLSLQTPLQQLQLDMRGLGSVGRMTTLHMLGDEQVQKMYTAIRCCHVVQRAKYCLGTCVNVHAHVLTRA